jgi:two-component system, NtrC family, response regulator AtoC
VTKPLRVLLIDDDPGIHDFMGVALEQEHVELYSALSAEEALQRVHGIAPDLILVDLVLPGMDGTFLLRELRSRGVRAAAVLITSHASMDAAVQALEYGALDVLTKPVRVAAVTQLVAEVRSATSAGNGASAKPLPADTPVATLIGQSPQIVEVYKAISRVAHTDSTVLIRGESGTGKELIARAIHRYSKLSGDFVAVNCAAIPETLLETELFGHEKGAFTGAGVSKPGKLERAAHGTFLFDEIGDMPLNLQAKLLRVLDQRRVERVGGSRMYDVDVRVISATHRDLQHQVRCGAFREDLYFRLAVVTIHVPPLRDRQGDIRLLTDHFIAQLATRTGRYIRSVHPEVYDRLERYSWPGNVRELRNVLERSLVLGRGPVLEPAELAALLGAAERATPFDQLVLEQTPLVDLEKRYIERVLRAAGGNQSEAARRLGIHRNTLRRKVREYGLSPLQC